MHGGFIAYARRHRLPSCSLLCVGFVFIYLPINRSTLIRTKWFRWTLQLLGLIQMSREVETYDYRPLRLLYGFANKRHGTGIGICLGGEYIHGIPVNKLLIYWEEEEVN